MNGRALPVPTKHGICDLCNGLLQTLLVPKWPDKSEDYCPACKKTYACTDARIGDKARDMGLIGGGNGPKQSGNATQIPGKPAQ